MFNATTIGKRIKDLRGKTPQEQCAKDLGISRGALSFYENGERKPDAEILVRMCEYFKVSADYLLGLSDVESVDPDIQTACELTGLSEEAVNKLADLNNSDKNKCLSKIISQLIESDSFLDLIVRFYSLIEKKNVLDYLEKRKKIFTEIENNENFPFEARVKLIRMIAEHFSLSYTSRSELPRSKAEKLYCMDTEVTDLVVKKPYLSLIDPYIIDAKDNVELAEFQITKRFQKTAEDVLRKSESDFPAYMEECDQHILSCFFNKLYTLFCTDSKENRQFGEYIKQLLEEEAENGKHQ